jgi:hypothetical protein
MLEFYYSREIVEKNTKENIEDLVTIFSNFYKFNKKERERYLYENYVPKIVAIASNLKELKDKDGYRDVKVLERLLRRSSEYDDFDPRYVQKYSNERPDVKAEINERLEKILKKLNINACNEARFVLFNALKYLAGKDIDKFKIREKEYKKEKLIWKLFPKRKEKELSELLQKPLDYVILPFEPDLEGLAEPFAKNKKVYARLRKEKLENYLKRIIERRLEEEIFDLMEGEYEPDSPEKFKEDLQYILKYKLAETKKNFKNLPETLFLEIKKDLEKKLKVEAPFPLPEIKDYFFVKILDKEWVSLRLPGIINAGIEYKGLGIGIINEAVDYKGIGIGIINEAGDYKGIGIGVGNVAHGDYKGIGIGLFNEARGDYKGIGIGIINEAYGDYKGVRIGIINVAYGDYKGIGIGLFNGAEGDYKGIGIGLFNEARGDYKGIGIGLFNGAGGDYKGVGIGLGNGAGGDYKGIGIGLFNVAGGDYKGVGIGLGNEALGDYKGVGIGLGNEALGDYKGVGIGLFNIVRNKLSGVQIGLINYAKNTEGFYLQLGLINYSNGKLSPLIKFNKK